MIDKKRSLKAIAISLVLLSVIFWNYTNLSGKEFIKPIHVVSLLVMGFLAGVFFVNLMLLFKKSNVGPPVK